MRRGRRAARREEEAGSHLGRPEMTTCSDGTSSSHKTASRSPGSPLCPAERRSHRGNNQLNRRQTEAAAKLKHCVCGIYVLYNMCSDYNTISTACLVGFDVLSIENINQLMLN